MASFVIKTYAVKLTNCASPYAWIMIFDEAGTYRARLNFFPMQETNSYNLTVTGNMINVDLNYRTFQSVVDILRNEKPITFHWSTTTKIAILATDDEPVGEEEHKAFPLIVRRDPIP